MATPKLWEIVGGAEKGGIIVREGKGLDSPEKFRLSTGSIVEEIVLQGSRLQYKLWKGSGPHMGWISTSVQGKVTVQEIIPVMRPVRAEGTLKLSVTKLSGSLVGRFVVGAEDSLAEVLRHASEVVGLAPGSIQLLHGSTILHSFSTCSQAGIGDDERLILMMSRKTLLSASRGEAHLWDIETGDYIRPLLGGYTRQISQCSFSKDGSLILTTSTDNRTCVWVPSTGECLSTLQASNGAIDCAIFSPSGARILTCSHRELSMWDAVKGFSLWAIEPGCSMAAFSPDGLRIVVARSQGYNYRHRLAWLSVACHGIKSALHLLDAASGRQLALLGDGLGHVRGSLSFSPCGTKVLTCRAGQNAVILDADTGSKEAGGSDCQELRGHRGATLVAAFSADGSMVVTGSEDSTAKLWHSSTGECWRTLHCHDGSVNFVAFSPDGTEVLTVNHSTLRLWNAANGWRMRNGLVATPAPIRDVVYDGTDLVTATFDEAQRWNKESGERQEIALGRGVTAVAVAPYR